MKQPKGSKFRTHIKEPRWQQIVSVVVVALFALIWLVAAITSD